MLGTANGNPRAAAKIIVPDLDLRKPTAEDGPAVSELVSACPPLDENSCYCHLLQCTDFSDTCSLAEANDQPVGWVSGYLPPREPSTLFIWQVAVHPAARGLSLGKQMILDILRRRICVGIDRLKTTVTPDNSASRGMFRSLSKTLDGSHHEEVHFERERHFDSRHNSEHLITIADFSAADLVTNR